MSNLFKTLNNLKSNIFSKIHGGGYGQKNSAIAPASSKQDLKLRESPSGRLGDDPLSFSSFSYPIDVTNDVQNGHYMLFYVNVQNRTKFEYQHGYTGAGVGGVEQRKVTKNVLGRDIPGTVRDNADKIYRSYTEIVDTKGMSTGKKVYYQNRAKKQLGLATYNRDTNAFNSSISDKRQRDNRAGISAAGNTTTRVTDSIAIYLPPNVQDTTSAGYNDMQTGMVGYALTGGMGVLGDIGSRDIEAAARKLAGGLGSFLREAATKLAAGVVESITESEGAVQGFNRLFGQANNPYLEVLFDSMALRTFTYNFTFAPRNQAETDEAQRIIQVFRFHMAPEVQGGQSRFLTLPSEFDIHYMYQSKSGVASENDYYNKIGTCVLTTCDVNYTPGAVKSFKDGAPTKITMSLTFKETDALTKDRIAEGY
jgi:hypothetical protein